MKKIIVVCSVVFFIILFLISYLLIKGGSLFTPKVNDTNNTTNTKKDGINEDYNKSFERIKPGIEASEQRETNIGKVLNQLPYKGKNFALYFDLEEGRYVLYINPAKKDEGNEELKEFLNKNGVLDKSWLPDLFLMYITPTPTAGAVTSTTPTPAP